jgi:NAD(P)-dependent dehydrogenase (short-subunit alcohol dehydrogenase family)
MTGLLEGQITIVTGAASGIGRATALLFAREGATVACADIDETGGKEVAEAITAGGGTAWFAPLDVRDQRAVHEYVDAVVDRFGRLDAAFNNAGITGTAGAVHECDAANWEKVMGTNVTGIYNCMHAEIPVMLAQESGGAIVNTSSNVGTSAVPNMPAYVTSKTAILGLTRAAALDYAQRGIRINALCPGITMTPFAESWYRDRGELGQSEMREHAARAPMGRHADPAEIAEAAAWLCSPRSSYLTGSALAADGGWTSC